MLRSSGVLVHTARDLRGARQTAQPIQSLAMPLHQAPTCRSSILGKISSYGLADRSSDIMAGRLGSFGAMEPWRAVTFPRAGTRSWRGPQVPNGRVLVRAPHETARRRTEDATRITDRGLGNRRIRTLYQQTDPAPCMALSPVFTGER